MTSMAAISFVPNSNIMSLHVRAGMVSEVLYEYPHESTGTEKSSHSSDVRRTQPVLYFLRFGFMGDTAFVVALLPEDDDGWDT
jgi:hypothetical protein